MLSVTCALVCTSNQELQEELKASILNSPVTPPKPPCRQETGNKGVFLLGPKSCQKPNPNPRTCWDGLQVLQPDLFETYMSAWCSHMGESSKHRFPFSRVLVDCCSVYRLFLSSFLSEITDGKLTLAQTWNCWLSEGSSLNTHCDSWLMPLCRHRKAAYQIFLRSAPGPK